jgi:NADH:ubiquinone oxidoreductase subunit K
VLLVAILGALVIARPGRVITMRIYDTPGVYGHGRVSVRGGNLWAARRRTLVGMLIAGELMFSAASLNFMTFNRFMAPDPAVGQVFVLFIMGLAAAEVAIALSIVIAVYRSRSIIPRRCPLNG